MQPSLAVGVVVASAVLWSAGLLLFLRTGVPRRRKLAWSGFLVAIGMFVGVVLPLRDLWTRFLWLMAILPLVAAADVILLRGRRGLTYWIRACGFEVITAFAAAAATRCVLGVLHVPAAVERLVR